LVDSEDSWWDFVGGWWEVVVLLSDMESIRKVVCSVIFILVRKRNCDFGLGFVINLINVVLLLAINLLV
jgi:hypothetical protein